MIHLAGLPAESRASRTELARAAEVPEAFLGKILQSLVRSGLMVSQRGVSGGFTLGKPASQITLVEVVEAVEGPLFLNRCVNPGEGCHRSAWCAGHFLWAEAQAAMVKVLRKSSILDLAVASARNKSATPADQVRCALDVVEIGRGSEGARWT
jgi:Rrf2 family protein